MARVRVGDRVLVQGKALATVMSRYGDGHYVDIDYDEPQPGISSWGKPYTFQSACIHQDSLELVSQGALW